MSHSEAAKLYQEFTELPADGTFDGEIPQPKSLDLLGPVAHLVYVSNKWHEREARTGTKEEYIRYIHDFKRNKPLLCYDDATKSYHIIGKVLVASEGIKDWSGKAPHTRGHIEYHIPKTLTFLGYLEEIVYTSEEDSEDYKVEFSRKSVLCSNTGGVKLYIAKAHITHVMD